jgi:hypothetical protein
MRFDLNKYLKNNILLKEDLESDIRKDLEKVSGIKSQTVNSKQQDQVVKKLDAIAKSIGLVKTKPDSSNGEIKYTAKWKDKDSGEEVDLYYFLDEPNTLRLVFTSGMSTNHELAKDCLSKDKWYEAFDEIGDSGTYDDEDYDF